MPQPLFTVVSALFDVERYVERYLESLESQTLDHSRVEVIVVNDGSTDASADLVRAWAATADFARVEVIDKENGGQASARNVGLDVARGDWVTFIDPDDTVSADYLERVADMLHTSRRTIDLVNVAIRILDEQEPGVERDHPRQPMFRQGDHVANLDRAVERFPGSAPTSFFRRSIIQSHALRFNESLRPNFEDGDFALRYLLCSPTRNVAYVASAKYYYLKRRSSTLGTTSGDPGRFTIVPQQGYLRCLQLAAERFGTVPMWVQHMILYELWWYFNGESARVRLGGATAERYGPAFLETLREISEYLDPRIVESATIRAWRPEWVAVLTHGLDTTPWSADHVEFDRGRLDSPWIRTRHLRTPGAPAPVYIEGGRPVQPEHTKIRPIQYWGRTLLVEDIAWLKRRRWLGVEVNGALCEWRPVRTRPVLRHPTARQLRQELSRASGAPLTSRVDGVLRGGRRFVDAWILCDRLHDADDSAEVLFKYLRKNRPEINAWFVIEKGTADWQRLAREGYRNRLIDPGSRTWRVAMSMASHIISSHADQAVIDPPQLRGLLRPDRKFVFLQHGVIKDDLADWLNDKSIDLFVTSTPDEYTSIVDDGTRYVFTSKEVKLTGLPRFDALLSAAQVVPDDDRNLILVTPTWRSWLAAPLAPGSQRRGAVPDIAESEFGQMWGALLRSSRLASVASEHRARIALLAHPNLQASLEHLDVPDHVDVLSFENAAAKLHFARTRVLVTDYSSTAFNAAFLNRAVVYFQFDRELMLGGAHVGRRGYFDYERLGMGPLTTSVVAAVDAIDDALHHAGPPQPYADRIARMFPFRDGRCSARVVEEILSLDD